MPTRNDGKNFNPSAPWCSAAKHSVGLITPGKDNMPAALVAVITLLLQSGETINLPPQFATSATFLAVNTVPAPISA